MVASITVDERRRPLCAHVKADVVEVGQEHRVEVNLFHETSGLCALMEVAGDFLKRVFHIAIVCQLKLEANTLCYVKFMKMKKKVDMHASLIFKEKFQRSNSFNFEFSHILYAYYILKTFFIDTQLFVGSGPCLARCVRLDLNYAYINAGQKIMCKVIDQDAKSNNVLLWFGEIDQNKRIEMVQKNGTELLTLALPVFEILSKHKVEERGR
ncbi:hypothetical protein LXL04_028551 [Taraxacum kok-saghyz]